jgi:long-chain acyl-CoA synthetase
MAGALFVQSAAVFKLRVPGYPRVIMEPLETLVDVYRASTTNYASRPLFGTKRNGTWEWITYADFAKDVDRFRGALAKMGVTRGDKVAAIANNRVEWAVAEYACFGLGAAFVPMYEQQSEKEWTFIVNDCAAKILIVATDAIAKKTHHLLTGDAPSLEQVISLDPATVVTGGDEKVHGYAELLKSAPAHEPIKVEKDDVACFIYTSGTTGDPKGVMLSHGNIVSNVLACRGLMKVGAEDRSLSFLPWAHVFGQTGELQYLFLEGASLALCESVDKLIDNLAEVQPTMLMSVPRIFNKLYTAVQKQLSDKPTLVQALVRAALKAKVKQREGHRLSLGEGISLGLADRLVFSKVRARFGGKLKYAMSGGAALSREVAEFIDSIGITVFEGYGLTETSPVVSVNYPGHRRFGTVGPVVRNVKVVIDGADGKPNKDGEIIVYGPSVMLGYHNRDAENAAVRTADGGFKTGDLGRLDEDGFLYITGRIKEQYKLENGKYVVPTPLEEQIKLSPLVANVMVYGDNRPYNVALVVANMDAVKAWAKEEGVNVGNDDQLLADAKVRKQFAAEIEKYAEKFKGFEAVRDFALISEDFTQENGMLTPSLKVKRKKVLDRWTSTLDALYSKKKESRADGPRATAP